MGFNFPDAPTLNQLHPATAVVGVPQYQWNGSEWVTPAYNPLNYVLKSGDTMTGALTLPADPTSLLHAATKQYVDTKITEDIIRRSNILTPHENLVISRTNNTTVNVTAEGVVLTNDTGISRRFGALNASPNITVVGVNGRDTGTEGANKWYHIWAIGRSSDGSTGTLFSEQYTLTPTPPTWPSGYDFRGLIGAVRNDGSSNFVNFFQRGNDVTRATLGALTSGTAGAYTAISLIPSIPQNARTVYFQSYLYNDVAGGLPAMAVAPEGSGTTATYGAVVTGGPFLEVGTGRYGGATSMLLTTPQQIKYYLSGTTSCDLYVHGWAF